MPATSPLRPIRVTVQDDSELVVRGLEAMLAPHARVVQLLPAIPPGKVGPASDLTLYDPAYVRRARSLDGTAPLRSGRMVAYSWDCTRAAVSAELARGAAGYISKRAPAERLVRDLLHARQGRVVVDVADPGHAGPSSSAAPAWPLTARETVVLTLITQGRSNRDIAEETRLSINSIKSYIRAAYGKIGVTSRSQAVLWGVQHGLLAQRPDLTLSRGAAPAPQLDRAG